MKVSIKELKAAIDSLPENPKTAAERRIEKVVGFVSDNNVKDPAFVIRLYFSKDESKSDWYLEMPTVASKEVYR